MYPRGTFCYGALSSASNLFTGDGHNVLAAAITITLGQMSASPLYDISTYLANALLNRMFRNQAFAVPTGHVLALYTSNPGIADSGSQLSKTGYSAQSIAFDAPTDGVGPNSAAITFGPAGEAWDPVTHQAVKDGSNNLLVFGSCTSFTLTTGQSRRYAAGEVSAAVS
jgi:phage tail protein X